MSEFELFQAALEIDDPAARRQFLKSTCDHDAPMLSRIEALLASLAGQSQFLNTPVVEQISEVADRGSAATMLVGNDSTQDDDSDATADHSHGPAPMTEPQDDLGDEIPLGYLEPSSKPESLGRLAHYEILEVVGRGAFGTVLRAFDEKLHRVVAIKVLAPEMATTSPARKRFIREAQASAAIRHEHVVSIYAVEEKPIPYLVMEYIPGLTLQQRLDERGPLDVPSVLRLGRQIAEGLAAAHAQELIHRDIKPGNILLETGIQERVKITDFGLARAADDASLTQSGTIAGTPMYMAPEQALGHKLDQRADLFSFGSVLYQMVSGRPPFRAPSALAVLKRVAEEAPRPISEIIPETPQWLCDIITKLHAKNPEERYQSAQEVADVLADCEAQLKANARLQDFSRIPQTKPMASSKRNWLTAGGVVSAMLLLGVIVITLTNKDGKQTRIEVPDGANVRVDPGQDGRVDITTADLSAPPPTAALPPTFTNNIGMEFVKVPKGKSWLGGGKDKLGDQEVEIPADFYLGKYEVTQEEWQKVMGENPSWLSHTGGGKDVVKDVTEADLKRSPVENVTWDQCQLFVEKLNQREQETGWVYRLPTEAEWEYACRGGPISNKLDSAFDFCLTRPTNVLLPEQANFKHDNGLNRSCMVGSYAPNVLGLYDMHGNAWEWCQDEFAGDPKDPEAGLQGVSRGSGWCQEVSHCPAANRYVRARSHHYNDLGLRLARVPFGAPSPAAKTPLIARQVPLPPTFTNNIGMEFVKVPKGKSWLGGGKDKLGDKEVEIPADFYLGKYEVTQEEWEKVMGENPSSFSRKGDGKDAMKDIPDADLKRFPVETVSWDQCQIFVAKLNKLEKESGWVYRLPKEVEWEYACRGGPMSDRLDSAFDFYFARPTNTPLPQQANFDVTELNRTCNVGSYGPNVLGLYQMHGNVWEWCEDGERADDGTTSRVGRGGCWSHDHAGGRAGFHNAVPQSVRYYDLGLRLARVPVGAALPEATTAAAVTPLTDADVQRIAALPAAEQVEEVRKELMRRNPGFDGQLTPTIKDDVVIGLKFDTFEVIDISPVRALKGMTALDCIPRKPGKSKSSDLSPLQGLPLTSLCVAYTSVHDLKPLEGMSLASLRIDGTKVVDLTPIENMPLTYLDLGNTAIHDLAAIQGSRLTFLNVGSCSQIQDLKPLEGMPLADLNVNSTKVRDLTPLRSMPLRQLQIQGTGVTDLSPLSGVQLVSIRLSPQNITQGMDVLREMKSLKTIGIHWEGGKFWPPAEFWQRYDKGEFTK